MRFVEARKFRAYIGQVRNLVAEFSTDCAPKTNPPVRAEFVRR